LQYREKISEGNGKGPRQERKLQYEKRRYHRHGHSVFARPSLACTPYSLSEGYMARSDGRSKQETKSSRMKKRNGLTKFMLLSTSVTASFQHTCMLKCGPGTTALLQADAAALAATLFP